MSADTPHTIPDHIVARIARLIIATEDVRQQAADDLKQIYADLREELRGMGWGGSAVSAEVAALKGAIAETRLDDEKKVKREEKGERVLDYVSLISRARAREGQSYAEAKGRGEVESKLAATVATGMQTAAGRSALVTALNIMIEGEEGEITDQSGGNGPALPVDTATEEQAACSDRLDASNSQETPPPADTAGGVTPSQTHASPAEQFEPPAFLRKTAAEYRPHCQRPDACGASGLKHCYGCQKAIDAAEREAVESAMLHNTDARVTA